MTIGALGVSLVFEQWSFCRQLKSMGPCEALETPSWTNSWCGLGRTCATLGGTRVSPRSTSPTAPASIGRPSASSSAPSAPPTSRRSCASLVPLVSSPRRCCEASVPRAAPRGGRVAPARSSPRGPLRRQLTLGAPPRRDLSGSARQRRSRRPRRDLRLRARQAQPQPPHPPAACPRARAAPRGPAARRRGRCAPAYPPVGAVSRETSQPALIGLRKYGGSSTARRSSYL